MSGEQAGLLPGPPRADDEGGGESVVTVVVAFGANLLIAIAKTIAAVLTGAASMLAEAAHSWADTGNEVFLLIAQRKAAKPADRTHPLGYGREVYVWSMFAALGLFAVGAGVSITHGIQELIHPEPASDFVIAYVVLGVSALLEGTSFLQANRQARAEARGRKMDLVPHILQTSDSTVRAVFFEDASALVGIVIAGAGIALHQITGSTVPDAIGSILVGVLLGVVAILLVQRNRQLLVGEVVDQQVWDGMLRLLLAQPEVARVTQLRLELVGARKVYLTGAVDLQGEPGESDAARRLADLQRRIVATPGVVAALVSLSLPEDASLTPRSP